MKGTTQERINALRGRLMQSIRPTMRSNDPHNDCVVKLLDLVDDIFEVDELGVVDGERACEGLE